MYVPSLLYQKQAQYSQKNNDDDQIMALCGKFFNLLLLWVVFIMVFWLSYDNHIGSIQIFLLLYNCPLVTGTVKPNLSIGDTSTFIIYIYMCNSVPLRILFMKCSDLVDFQECFLEGGISRNNMIMKQTDNVLYISLLIPSTHREKSETTQV